MKSFAAIILAAGLSRRMGEFKPLLTLGGKTIAEHLVTTFFDNGVAVYLVTGYRAEELQSLLKNEEVIPVYNTDYERGMFTSVQAGVRALKPGYKAFFIAPVDIPMVKSATINKLITAYEENPGKIIFPVFQGKRGHPPLVPLSLATIIAQWQSNGSLRDVFTAYNNLAMNVNVPDSHVLLDIDTPEDYQLLKNNYQEGKASKSR